MNRRATASVDAIKKALPFEPSNELLLLIIFGSQVRNEETPESDLDILCVTRTESKQFYASLHSAMAGVRDGVRSATVLEHTPQTIGRNANLYGMPEYGALRGYRNGESVILYRSKDACSALDGIMAGGVGGCCGDEDGHNEKDVCDTDWCALQWLSRAENGISEGLLLAERRGCSDRDLAGFICYIMYESIDSSIKACLLHHDIMFPFTRDIHALHEMLPSGSHMPMDFVALSNWSAYFGKHINGVPKKNAHHYNYTRNDVEAASDAARRAYALVSRKLSTARHAPGPRRRILERIKHVPIRPQIFIMPSSATRNGRVARRGSTSGRAQHRATHRAEAP